MVSSHQTGVDLVPVRPLALSIKACPVMLTQALVSVNSLLRVSNIKKFVLAFTLFVNYTISVSVSKIDMFHSYAKIRSI